MSEEQGEERKREKGKRGKRRKNIINIIMVLVVLTRPYGRQSRDRRRTGFGPGCSQSIRGIRRKSQRWDNHWGSFFPFQIDPHKDLC